MSDWPPLRAIQAFEAVGRHGSVTAAAEDLSVSPGAISRQVHILERFLHVRLVQRHGRGIELTSWGRLYLPHVTAAMNQLHRGTQELKRSHRSHQLCVSALPSLTNKWLGPLLFTWKELRPEANIVLEGVDPEPKMDDGAVDFRISYGIRQRLHERFTHLFRDFLIPVGSPELLRGRELPISLLDFANFPLLWIDWGSEFAGTPTWRDWFTLVGMPADHIRCDLTFSLSSGAIDAAIEGRGIVLAQHSMVANALHSNSLLRLSDRYLQLPEPYFLAWNSAALDKPMGSAFHTWLKGEASKLEAPT